MSLLSTVNSRAAAELEAARVFHLGIYGYLIASNLNFCPPTAAATIAPVLGSVKTATPCSYLAFSATPDAATAALALALISHLEALKVWRADCVWKKMISEKDPPPTCAPMLTSLMVTLPISLSC